MLFRRSMPQPIIGIATTVIALATMLVVNWRSPLLILDLRSSSNLIEAMVAILAIMLTDRYPVHISYHAKASLSTIVLYLIAALLSPPLAMLVAGIGKLASELAQRGKGNLPSDIATCVSRWMLVVFVTATVTSLPAHSSLSHVALLVVAAAVMFLGDMLTAGLEIGPIVNEPPLRVIWATIRTSWLIEAVLYCLGIIAVFAVAANPYSIVFLIAPVCMIYIAFRNTHQMQDHTRRLLEQLADAVDLRDPYTGGHSRRVTGFTEGIIQELGLKGPDADLIITSARVHDIGKIGVPDAVLNNPGKLAPDEWAIMRRHPELGATFLARHPDFARGVGIVRHHHERWDGTGYPDRLAGLDIPFGARLIAVADSYDAMTSDRPYRPGMSQSKAIQILLDGRGTQWEPALVDAFILSLKVPEPAAAVATQLTSNAGMELAR